VENLYINLALLAAFVFLYSLTGGRLERTPINGAVVFTAFGMLFGPMGFGLLTVEVNAELLRTLAELTLAVVLFTDAATADLNVLRHSVGIPRRLLLFGLPLTILLGFGAGVLLFDNLGFIEIAILATMLAPTDAALGKAVVTNHAVPANIREGLNAESGLNDGICVPVLFMFLALAFDKETGSPPALAFKLLAEEIGIGLAAGIGITLFSYWLLHVSMRRGWIGSEQRQLAILSLAFVIFAVTQLLGGSGFIAAFAGGMLFGWMARNRKNELLAASEGTGDVLAMITWVLFGAGVISGVYEYLTWTVVAYALLSLTVVRMLPVFAVLSGTKLRTGEKLFIGWFGPRGLATIVFGVIVLGEHLPGGDTVTITAVTTIVLSIIGHGLSANPLVAALASRNKHAA
jgi:sodium/hydrogen antiporter